MSNRTPHRGSRHLTRAHSLFCAGLAVAALTSSGAVEAQDFVLTNIQPVDVQSIEGLAYDPTDPTGSIWFEPMMRDSATTPPTYRLNLDLEIKNDTPDWQRLDSVEVDYLGTGAAALNLVGDNLVRYDSTYYVHGSGTKTKRGVIANGGFGSSGLIIQRNLIEAELFGPLAGDVLEVNRFLAQVFQSQAVHVMTRAGGVKNIGLQHGIEANASQRDAMVGKHRGIVLEVLPELGAIRILQQRLQCAQHFLPRQLVWRAGVIVCNRHVGGLALLHRE